jgi:hypothetical protein
VDRDLAFVRTVAIVWNVAAVAIKQGIRGFEQRSHPWLLQGRDFELVRQARDRARSPEERLHRSRVLWAMDLLIGFWPLAMLAWLVLSEVLR